ncbi:hypothetical protein VTI74DRAFT_11616 [Chaetomium olivicolor]
MVLTSHNMRAGIPSTRRRRRLQHTAYLPNNRKPLLQRGIARHDAEPWLAGRSPSRSTANRTGFEALEAGCWDGLPSADATAYNRLV